MVFPEALKVTIYQKSGDQENFVMSVSRHREVCHNYENLKNEIVARYPSLLQFDEIKFFWIDDEGDEITILNHADYFDYMDSCSAGGVQKRRIYVKGVNNPKQDSVQDAPMEECSAPRDDAAASLPEDVPVHINIVCDVCDDTIRGHRYKCLQCFNYDLCMRCEAKYRHKDHLMVRIPTPQISRRGPFRLFDKLRGMATEVSSQSEFANASDVRENEYENCKRSKRYHRRHSKDREESREQREEKERKERKHRRERSAKCAEERRSARYGHGSGHHFNFTHLLNQVIDPANISAFLSADAAAAAAAAAAESAHEAARATMANCPVFAATSHASTTSTSSTANAATASASTSAKTGTNVTAGDNRGETSASSAGTNDSPRNDKVLDLSWLSPTPESISKINQTFSKILDPLGMNIEIRSNGAAPKPAQTQTPPEEKQDKTTETANTPTTSTPSQTSSLVQTSNKSTEIDPVADLRQKLEATLLAESLTEKGQKMDMTHSDDDDDDSLSVSSVSLLSDNETGNNEKTEKKWTLVDLPNDEDKPVEIAKDVTAEATSIGQASATPVTPASVPEVSSASSATNVVNPIDYEQLGKALKQHIEAEMQAAETSKNKITPTIATATTPPPSTQTAIPLPASVNLPTSTAIPLPPPNAPQISVQTNVAASRFHPFVHQLARQLGTRSQNATITSSQPIQTAIPMPAPARASSGTEPVTYSSRSHINHAVHAMIAMGFSNEGGWLVQLLESVNGDIPRALDLLTPHKFNP